MPDSSPLVAKAISRAKSRGRVLRLVRGAVAAGVLVAASWTGSSCWNGRHGTKALEIGEALHVLELPDETTLPELRVSSLNRLRSETKRLIRALKVQAREKDDLGQEARRYLNQLAEYAQED